MLERRGLKDREWAVEWEASALEFLLEKGFSPEMGARPLKRAIDQYVIAPLAATIVEQRFPEGDQFVFVRSDGRAIQAEFVDPDAETCRAGASSSRRARRAAGAAVDDPGAERQRCGARRACERRARASRRRSPSAEWEQLKAAPFGGDAGERISGRGPTASRRSRDWR